MDTAARQTVEGEAGVERGAGVNVYGEYVFERRGVGRSCGRGRWGCGAVAVGRSGGDVVRVSVCVCACV